MEAFNQTMVLLTSYFYLYFYQCFEKVDLAGSYYKSVFMFCMGVNTVNMVRQVLIPEVKSKFDLYQQIKFNIKFELWRKKYYEEKKLLAESQPENHIAQNNYRETIKMIEYEKTIKESLPLKAYRKLELNWLNKNCLPTDFLTKVKL